MGGCWSGPAPPLAPQGGYWPYSWRSTNISRGITISKNLGQILKLMLMLTLAFLLRLGLMLILKLVVMVVVIVMVMLMVMSRAGVNLTTL